MEIFESEVKLFMVFDILGDTIRSGPLQWNVKRTRLEDIKNHVLDLLLIYRILEKKLPKILDFKKIFDYIICHDLPEVITGDITAFEGVSSEEKDEVTKIAIEYLSNKFCGVMNFKEIFNNYENKADIEAKVVKLIDKIHSATTFIKYQSEREIDADDAGILPELKKSEVVIRGLAEGKDVADIFYDFHTKSIFISEEECTRYSITLEDANKIVATIRGFAAEMYKQKVENTLLDVEDDFPLEAMKYKRRRYNIIKLV